MAAGHCERVTIPELRNPRYREFYDTGRRRRLAAELAGQTPDLPLFSRNPTYQSLFSKGWHSVSAQDVRLAKVSGLAGEKARARIHTLLGELN